MHQRRTGRGVSSHSSNGQHGEGGNMYGGRGNNGSYNPGRLEAGGGMSSSEMNAGIMEQQNNDRISELSEHVARLKGLTVEIGNEVKEQNSLLDNMGDNFGNVGDMLAGSLKRIGTMLERGGAKHMCYMIGFVVFVMVFLYWIMAYKGQSGA
mmetsp:Transcript_43923/g.133793  ORF Transcript_43923/g.133793 Transcript_43923/m.133793 type:complete len:152 (+) Transcript_43923:209-664(+)|eukprot:CAMPEP_0113533892 /NCGR_PEP_ID=MMETSP0015_2-20120614/4866_1 /TAXON_ID=2838 /ORGANISM="Odontella" /LENGTH=151 /DNA_ID=CAMNT_0000433013 /DNA_START=175 /DNA_END=630 /DNA_ORIENTATION=- /assembly_acc=CAM_ASM_000160